MSKSILIVEDNEINQTVLSAMLKKMGHSVELAENGQQAIEKFQPERHEIVFMDCQMPVMDGIEATKILRTKYGEQPWIIALTGNVFASTKDRCFEVGMNAFLTKPITIEAIKKALEEKSTTP